MNCRHIYLPIIAIFSLIVQFSIAQQPLERVVFIESELLNDSISFSWNEDLSVEQYYLFSRELSATTWGDPQAILSGEVSSFKDELNLGQSREYAIYKSDPFPYRDTFVLTPGNYFVQLQDQFDKGLCCNFGVGYYLLKNGIDTLFLGSEFLDEYSDSFYLDSLSTVQLEILPDLFGNHLGWEILNVDSAEVMSEFGPLGTYLRRAPSLGMISVSNKKELFLSNENILVLVDSLLFSDLQIEMEELHSDFVGMGYHPIILPIDISKSVIEVKQIIKDYYDVLPNLSTLYLIGHIPVPYSGDIYPDTHVEIHRGAWAADSYYGDIDGEFSDSIVNDISAFSDRNHNVPGDGKFDQGLMPSELEIAVGRVDFSRMTITDSSELSLTRAYLNKAHQWKTGQIHARPLGLVDDNFGRAIGAPASNGWRNQASLLGPSNVEEKDFLTALTDSSHLWAYGCGSGNQFGAEGVASTEDLVVDSLQAIFLMTFGSHFGDWDRHDNFLRACLGSGTVLCNAWVGNPHWFVHQMGTGESIGNVALKNINSHYLPGPQLMHVALLGDPTVHQFVVDTIQMIAIQSGLTGTELSWEKPVDTVTYQYKIYRRVHEDSLWIPITLSGIFETNFIDTTAIPGMNYYLIQPEKLIQNNSGCFYQPGVGIIDSVEFIPVSGISELQKNELTLWPNPTEKFLHISGLSSRDDLFIFDDQGNILYSIDKKEVSPTIRINTSEWKSGIYFIQIGVQSGKFVKLPGY